MIHYKKQQYPCLDHQTATWAEQQPLKGLRIIDATPVFNNTRLKHQALMASGASLTIGLSDSIPCDGEVVAQIRRQGIPTVRDTDADPGADVVMDCGGMFSHYKPELGFVELTRSGIYKYENHKAAVFMADGGRVKMIETLLGTGESYLRAMAHLGHEHWSGRTLVVFGSGKVGCGIIAQAKARGAQVIAVTERGTMPAGFEPMCRAVIDHRHLAQVIAAVESAQAIVTATGHPGIIQDPALAQALMDSQALLANMGLEDEYGPLIPPERVLCQKQPINFSLEEPTKLQYIEATMALSNLGALYLRQYQGPCSGPCSGSDPCSGQRLSGIINPPAEMENILLDITRHKSLITDQMEILDLL